MAYTVRLDRRAERQFADLPLSARVAVVERLADLAEQPRGRHASQLKGRRDPVLYRTRVAGDYRVIFAVDDESQRVQVSWIGLRRDAYKHR